MSRPGSITYEELAHLLGKYQADKIYQQWLDSVAYRPDDASVTVALRIVGSLRDNWPTDTEMRTAGPAFVAWLRERARKGRASQTAGSFVSWAREALGERSVSVPAPERRPYAELLAPSEYKKLREMGKKWCPGCQQIKDRSQFKLKRNGKLDSYCADYCGNFQRVQARRLAESRAAKAQEVTPLESANEEAVFPMPVNL